ncbi:Alpha/Beta hydrolase protein [Xylariaceae sp. FL0594]|nr:Alpha/Beta hydrolase protein [Xylariaceae sp. FL0594]
MATEHVLIGAAAQIPVGADTSPIISYVPITIPVPGRPVYLQVRVTIPASSPSTSSSPSPLPIILLSHGHGPSYWLSSLEGYAPLAEFWAKHGFAVIQPTHLSSRTLGLSAAGEEGNELFWKSRPQDMTAILDNLDVIEDAVQAGLGLGGGRRRLDRERVAAAGHSLGGMTTSLLLGSRNTDPRDGSTFTCLEPRVKAGVVIGGTGNGGSDDMSENGRVHLCPFYGMDFETMETRALIIAGDTDVSPHLTTRGADWHWDPYTYAPGEKDLLLVKGGHHGFGGVSGWDAKECQDESPERLALVQRMSLAYLKSRLYEGDDSWEKACEVLKGLEELGSVERKSG